MSELNWRLRDAPQLRQAPPELVVDELRAQGRGAVLADLWEWWVVHRRALRGGLNSGAAGAVYINGSDGDYMACDGTLRLMSRLVDVLEERGGRWLGPTYQGLVDDYTAFVKTLDVKLAAGTIRLLDVKLEKVRWKMDHRLSENWYEPSGLN